MTPKEHVPLGPHCTMGVGGPARWFVELRDERDVAEARRWARDTGVPFLVLGGGSNLLVADRGVDALVGRMAIRGVATREAGATVEVTVAAGEPWDEIVRWTVEQGWAGLECLSGIPGLVGATPIQNVGAYGQDVSETVVGVRAVDSASGDIVTLTSERCGFAYRDSVFKSREPGRWIVLAVTYRLARGGAPAVRYAELERHLRERGIGSPTVAEVRAAVLAIRRAKSMVIEEGDPNRRSCGSFFTNPIVTAGELAKIEALVGDAPVPRWPERDGRVKLSAAWLIERAGYTRGHVRGPVGLSTRHALAIVSHDGARARDVAEFAREISDRVQARFGVRLTPEPVFWGLADDRCGGPRNGPCPSHEEG